MTSSNIQNEKKIAAEKAAEYIKENMIIGIGSGSTVYFFIKKIAGMVENGLKVQCVSTSNETTRLANSLKIPLLPIGKVKQINLTVDGTDEVDKNLNGIKGGGGALLFEKIVANISEEIIWIVDSSKIVKKLGKFPLPVEVVQFGFEHTLKKLEAMKFKPILRQRDSVPYVTDSGHFIIDLHLGEINNPLEINRQLDEITGVVENGLFINIAKMVIAGKGDKTEILKR
jgi:ribose 5-phosphate isomerase A